MNRLAINGGNPVRSSYIAYGKQTIDQNDIDKVVEVLNSDYLTTGPYVAKFESKIAEFVGSKYAIAVSNGTAALHMACHAAGISEGDEVLVSSLTFAASSNAVLYCGGTPVFVDVDPRSYNITPENIIKKITDKTKAIVAVDFSGQSVDIDEINKIAKKYNLIVIEDAAHALGSEYKGEKVGSKADMTMFSFHPVKPVTTAEGGIITTNNLDFYEKMKIFRSHGITREENKLIENHGPWYYEQQDLGFNYRLTDIQSALGISQMNKIISFINRRREIVGIYNSFFKNIKEIIVPYENSYSNSGWHIYVIRLKTDLLSCSRKEFYNAMQAENIGVNVHYLPVYLMPYYQSLGYKKGECPIAEEVYENIITLPLYPSMTQEDIEDVVKAVNKVLNFYRK